MQKHGDDSMALPAPRITEKYSLDEMKKLTQQLDERTQKDADQLIVRKVLK